MILKSKARNQFVHGEYIEKQDARYPILADTDTVSFKFHVLTPKPLPRSRFHVNSSFAIWHEFCAMAATVNVNTVHKSKSREDAGTAVEFP